MLSAPVGNQLPFFVNFISIFIWFRWAKVTVQVLPTVETLGIFESLKFINPPSPILKEPFCFWQICASRSLYKCLLNKMHFKEGEDHVLLPRVFQLCPEFMFRSSDQSSHQKPVKQLLFITNSGFHPRKTMVMMKMMAISSHLRVSPDPRRHLVQNCPNQNIALQAVRAT